MRGSVSFRCAGLLVGGEVWFGGGGGWCGWIGDGKEK
jgi:hypothetical protein